LPCFTIADAKISSLVEVCKPFFSFFKAKMHSFHKVLKASGFFPKNKFSYFGNKIKTYL
jgi:hypothetical protein